MSWIDFFPPAGFITIVVLIIARIFFLRQKGIRIGSSRGRAGFKKILLYFLFLLIFIIWLFELVKPVLDFSFSLLPREVLQPLLSSLILEITGIILIIAAIIILTLTLLHFKQSLRFGLDKNNQGNLVTTGIFSFSRNPFFISLNLYFTGTAIIFPSLFFIIFALLAIVGTHFFILKEEKFLNNVHGKEYNNYSRKVNRYFGKS